jgi:hypothetical protein
MKSIQLEGLLSEALELDRSHVKKCMRYLKEAGLIATGGRGTGAPEMEPLDGARALLALLGTDRQARAVEAARDFGQLRMRPAQYEFDDEDSLERLTGLSGEFTAEEALAALLRVFAMPVARKPMRDGTTGWQPVSVCVVASGPGVSITWAGSQYHFSPDGIEEDGKRTLARWHGAIETTRTIYAEQIGPIALGLAGQDG